MPADVGAYIARSDQWPAELAALRPILLGAGLTEEIKGGGKPLTPGRRREYNLYFSDATQAKTRSSRSRSPTRRSSTARVFRTRDAASGVATPTGTQKEVAMVFTRFDSTAV